MSAVMVLIAIGLALVLVMGIAWFIGFYSVPRPNPTRRAPNVDDVA